MRLDFRRPAAGIVEEQGDGSLLCLRGGQCAELRCKAVHLCLHRRRRTIRQLQRRVHLFLRTGVLAKTEVTDEFGAVGHGLHGPEGDGTGNGCALDPAQFTGPGCCSITQNRP